MRVSIKWLKEYVDVPMTAAELAAALTQRGVAVEAVESLNPGISGVLAGRIIALEPHPDPAVSLRVAKMDVAAVGGNALTVVTGAPNIKVGDMVPVALTSAELPGGWKIGRQEFRGVYSHGMLCAESELLEGKEPKEGEGVWILPPDVEPGTDIVDLLGLDGEVLLLDLTPNYASHCLSMLGVAREVAAITGGDLRLPAEAGGESAAVPGGGGPDAGGTVAEGEAASMVSVEIADPDLCSRYSAHILRDIRVGPSPLWMQNRLRAAGMRAINNIVDVTNYVMLEMGQPLHAFDYETLRGRRIVVRRARPGETMRTLDGQERALDSEMLVIADAEAPAAVAGVMGGLDTEVTEKTRTVLLESAHFENKNVRKTARKLGIFSEAQARFSKGVDPSGVVAAAQRAMALLEQIGAARRVPGVVDVYPRPAADKTVRLRPARVNMLTGLSLTVDEMTRSLQRLGLEVRAEGGGALLVTLPTRRPDLSEEIDLVEEIARVYGYDQIPATLPEGPARPGRRMPRQALELRVRQFLMGAGCYETVPYSLEDAGAQDRLRLPQDSPLRRVVRLSSPLTEEQAQLRTSTLSTTLAVLAHNAQRQVDDLAVFEIGPIYWPEGEGSAATGGSAAREPRRVAIGAIGNARAKGWGYGAEPADFYWLKGVVEALIGFLGLSGSGVEFVRSAHPSLHPGRQAELRVGGQSCGVLGEAHPDVTAAFGLSGRPVAAELDWDALAALALQAEVRYQPLPRFPAVQRDLALVLPVEVAAARVAEVIRASAGNLLRDVRLFDLYQGAPVPAGKRSLAYSLTYRADDRTLTDAEVDAVHNGVREALRRDLGAELRS